jgi:hypothetical protein
MGELPVAAVECEYKHLATFVCIRVDHEVSIWPRLGAGLERLLHLAGYHSNTHAPVRFALIHRCSDRASEQSCGQALEQRCAKYSTHG